MKWSVAFLLMVILSFSFTLMAIFIGVGEIIPVGLILINFTVLSIMLIGDDEK